MKDYGTLISAHALRSHLGDDGWRIVDTRFRLTDPAAGRGLFDEEHIPGAVYLHLDDDLSAPVTPVTGRHPLPEPYVFARTLCEAGIDNRSQVVVYDDAGGGIASRLWWMMRWLGHRRVAVLDGGFPAWKAGAYPVTREETRPSRGEFVAQADDEAEVSLHALRDGMRDGGYLLVDAREATRFRGDAEPIDAVAGRIPGAVNLPWQANFSGDGTFLEERRLRELWADRLGGHPPDRVVCMCGSGVTACIDLLAMEVAGYGGGRLYAGSWSEWIRDPGRPVASGPD